MGWDGIRNRKKCVHKASALIAYYHHKAVGSTLTLQKKKKSRSFFFDGFLLSCTHHSKRESPFLRILIFQSSLVARLDPLRQISAMISLR